MHKLGLLAFVLTTAVLVPAAYHHLGAAHEQVQKLVAPDTAELEIDGAKVVMKIEHPLVDPGEGLRVELVASGAKHKHLDVGLIVYGSSGSEGARVPSPPIAVAKRNATLKIDAAGNGRAELVVPLRGARERGWDETAYGSYTVLAMAPKAADKLDRLHSGAHLIGDGGDIPSYNKSASEFMRIYHGWGEREGEDATLFADHAVARASAYTRAMNPSIAIEAPSRVESGKAFSVAVVVKNPSKKSVPGLEVSLDTPAGTIAEHDVLIGATAMVMPDSATFDLAPGESRRFEFRVMPADPGIVAVHARVRCSESECNAPDALLGSGTLDAVEVVQVPVEDGPTPPTVVTR